MVTDSVGNNRFEAERWFDKGVVAFNRSEFNYAIEFFTHAIHANPGHLDYRRQMHRASRRRYKANGGISSVDNIKLAAIRSRLLTAEVKKDWNNIDLLAESAIAINPVDGSLFAELASAATQLNNYELAKYAWTSAIKLDRTNCAYYRKFGALLQEHGEFDMARNCFSQLSAIDPTGRIKDELLKSLEVASLLERGYTTAENSRDVEVGKAPRPAKEVELETTEIDGKTSTGSQIDPRLKGFVALAEDHAMAGCFEPALEAYRNALKLAPGNVSLRRRMEDVELLYLRRRALKAQEAAREDPEDTRKGAFAMQRLTEVTSRELSILTMRVKECPHDMLQVFRLADLYRRSNQLELAVPLFEQASVEPKLCTEALIGLGECWVRTDGKTENGRLQLEKALRLIDPQTKPNSCKLAHYWLGRLYEARKRFDEADRHYGEIVKLDPAFRDVAKRRLQVFEQRSQLPSA